MVTVTGPHTTSALPIIEDEHLNDNSLPRGGGVRAGATPLAPTESGLDRGVNRIDPRRGTIDRWTAALARGNDVEVDRLVRLSRIARVGVAASSQLAVMLGQAAPTASSEVAERAPTSRWIG